MIRWVKSELAGWLTAAEHAQTPDVPVTTNVSGTPLKTHCTGSASVSNIWGLAATPTCLAPLLFIGYVMCDCHAAATFGSFANKHVTGNRKRLLLVGHWLNQAAMAESCDTPAAIICLVMTIDQKVFKV